jgi:hypothetical protein
MKKLIVTLAALLVTVAAYGQGAVTFNNRVTGVVDAKVTLASDGSGVSTGFTAQLYGGPAGTAIDKLVALTPSTTFRTGNAAGYVNPVDVTVTGVAAGATATLVMRAFNGTDYNSANSTIKGQSGTFNVALGGGTLPPANLTGLTAFSLAGGTTTPPVVPEPSTIALGALGAAVLLFRRRK